MKSEPLGVAATDIEKLEILLFGLSRKLLALNALLKSFSRASGSGSDLADIDSESMRLAVGILHRCVLELVAISSLPCSPLSEITPSLLLDYDNHFSRDVPVKPSEIRHKRSVAFLTRRECQVLQYLGNGMCNKEIAAELGLSVKTIETYRERIMTKLDAHSLSDLIRYAIRHALVEI